MSHLMKPRRFILMHPNTASAVEEIVSSVRQANFYGQIGESSDGVTPAKHMLYEEVECLVEDIVRQTVTHPNNTVFATFDTEKELVEHVMSRFVDEHHKVCKLTDHGMFLTCVRLAYGDPPSGIAWIMGYTPTSIKAIANNMQGFIQLVKEKHPEFDGKYAPLKRLWIEWQNDEGDSDSDSMQ